MTQNTFATFHVHTTFYRKISKVSEDVTDFPGDVYI